MKKAPRSEEIGAGALLDSDRTPASHTWPVLSMPSASLSTTVTKRHSTGSYEGRYGSNSL